MCCCNHGQKELWAQDISAVLCCCLRRSLKLNQEAVNMGWNIKNKTLNWPKIWRGFSKFPLSPYPPKITQDSPTYCHQQFSTAIYTLPLGSTFPLQFPPILESEYILWILMCQGEIVLWYTAYRRHCSLGSRPQQQAQVGRKTEDKLREDESVFNLPKIKARKHRPRH